MKKTEALKVPQTSKQISQNSVKKSFQSSAMPKMTQRSSGYNPYINNKISNKTQSSEILKDSTNSSRINNLSVNNKENQGTEQQQKMEKEKSNKACTNNPWAKPALSVQKKKSVFGVLQNFYSERAISEEKRENNQNSNDNSYFYDDIKHRKSIQNIEQMMQISKKIDKLQKQRIECEEIAISQRYPQIHKDSIVQKIEMLKSFVAYFTFKKVNKTLLGKQNQGENQFEWSEQQSNEEQEINHQMQFIRIPYEFRRPFVDILRKFGKESLNIFELEDHVGGAKQIESFLSDQEKMLKKFEQEIEYLQNLQSLVETESDK